MSTSKIILKAFLDRCEPEKKQALTRFLPPSVALDLDQLPDLAKEIQPKEFAKRDGVLNKVHWSWFIPTLKTYSATEQRLFISTLGNGAAKNLAKTLLISSSPEPLTAIGKAYLRQVLLSSLVGSGHSLLPEEYIPIGPLSLLLKLSKKELMRLIDFLSLYDLAAELRQIVETKILKKIYSILSEEERKFLKNAMAHKEPFSFGRIGLDRWDGLEDTFRTSLHKKGLTRLAVALSGQPADIIWYVCHQLDIGRGSALFKQCVAEAQPVASARIIEQIKELL